MESSKMVDGSILAENIQGDYKLSMWIPSELAGRVVGKKGVVITNIQRETRVKQMNALSAVGESLWIAVVMIGDWKNITAAYKAVSDIVSGGK
jgi:rRNA processing protein Krr1/Pno1